MQDSHAQNKKRDSKNNSWEEQKASVMETLITYEQDDEEGTVSHNDDDPSPSSSSEADHSFGDKLALKIKPGIQPHYQRNKNENA